MKYKITCKCCGNTQKSHLHTLNRGLLDALAQTVEFYKKNGKGCNLQKDIWLTKNQYNNYQKLQYFKLVKKAEYGRWLPTEKAYLFLNGQITVLHPVLTLSGKVLSRKHEAWKSREERSRKTHVTQIKNFDYNQYEK